MKFVGVDLTSAFAQHPRPIDIAVLDDSLAVAFQTAAWPLRKSVENREAGALSQMILGAVALAPEERAILAVDGPQGLASPGQSMRVCERILGTPGRTPSQLPPAQESGAPFQGYIRSSLDLFAALTGATPPRALAGIDDVQNTDADLWEVYPGAEWTVLADRRLPLKTTLQGRQERWRLFRQLRVAFAPGAQLPTADQLDALIGAYLAWSVHHRPDAVEMVGHAPNRNGEIREGYILHAAGRIREGLRPWVPGWTDAELPRAEAAAFASAESVAPDWNDDYPLELMLTDFGIVHGKEPENAWLAPGADYVLETLPPNERIRICLTYSPIFPGGKEWRASPPVKAILRRLNYTTPHHLKRANAVSLSVRVVETVGSDVNAFLKAQQAEGAYKTVRELLRQHYPAAGTLEVEVVKDWDEPNWKRVMMTLTLPTPYPPDWAECQQRFDDQFLENVPLNLISLFVVRTDFAPE